MKHSNSLKLRAALHKKNSKKVKKKCHTVKWQWSRGRREREREKEKKAQISKKKRRQPKGRELGLAFHR